MVGEDDNDSYDLERNNDDKSNFDSRMEPMTIEMVERKEIKISKKRNNDKKYCVLESNCDEENEDEKEKLLPSGVMDLEMTIKDKDHDELEMLNIGRIQYHDRKRNEHDVSSFRSRKRQQIQTLYKSKVTQSHIGKKGL